MRWRSGRFRHPESDHCACLWVPKTPSALRVPKTPSVLVMRLLVFVDEAVASGCNGDGCPRSEP